MSIQATAALLSAKPTRLSFSRRGRRDQSSRFPRGSTPGWSLRWLRTSQPLLSLLVSVVLVASMISGCAVELAEDGGGLAPDPNSIPSADQRTSDGRDGAPHRTDEDFDAVDNTYNLPGIDPVSEQRQPDAVPNILLRVAETEPEVPARADGSEPGENRPKEEDAPKKPVTKKKKKKAAAASAKGESSSSKVDETGCKQAADCAVVANGCIVMACELDDNGVGTCKEKAFVCQCMPGQDGSCDDNNPCTVDTCSDVGACDHTPTQACDDGNVCTADSCDNTEVPGQPNLAVCVYVAANATTCDDGDPCTGGSVCTASACTAGFQYACDDGVACTFDVCMSGKGCVHTPTPSCEGK